MRSSTSTRLAARTPSRNKPTPDAERSEKLLSRVREVLKEQVSEVRLSDRLTDSPSCLVVPEGGLGPTSSACCVCSRGRTCPLRSGSSSSTPNIRWSPPSRGSRRKGEKSDTVGEAIELLYDQALLSEGSPIDDPARVAKRLTRLMTSSAEALLSGSSS